MTDDWRLVGQQTWLADRDLCWREWRPSRPGCNHDHCAFCHAEITATGNVEFTAGYVTADDHYTWICPPCSDDFRHRFHWRVVPPPADS